MNAKRVPKLFIVAASLSLITPACGRGSTSSTSSTTSSSLPPAATPVQALPSAAATPPVSVPAPAIVDGQGMPMSFAPLARRADPAVATVKARVERESASGRKRLISEGLGTAFVYDPDGFMLTNNHVVEGATDIAVSFVDGRELKASVIARDKHTDIAVLKVEQKGLSALPLGDSDAVEVGDWVVAIGNPFGLSHTVSAGILSAKGRTREDVKGLDPSGYFNFLQTDASINPGNSGGPLLDLKGAVVGINAAVRANANNIGFAIPINMVKQLLPLLLRDGKIHRSAIGVVVGSLNSIEADRLKRPDLKGAWVQSVVAGGPGDRAGISPDDVILAFNGQPISDPNELRWLASIAGVNSVATLRVARGERVFELRLTLGELSDSHDDSQDDH